MSDAGPPAVPPADLDPDRCYRAMTTRDRRFDGRFFVAVVTTGIYCRPVCPAPTPRRRNVRFYACAAAAEAAGFRPCKRCRPETAPGTPAWVGTSAIVARALRILAAEGASGSGDGVVGLADRLGVSERHLRRLFLSHLGAPPGAIARANRVHLARRLLDDTSLAITDVAFAAGFESVRQFNHAMRATFGAPPRAMRALARRSADDAARSRRTTPAKASAAPSESLRLRLAYRPPFDWAGLRDFLAVRATPGIEVVERDAYHRSISLDGAPAILSLRPLTERFQVLLTLRMLGSDEGRRASALPLGSIARLVAGARRMLDLDADPSRIAAQLRRSDVLAPGVRARPGLRVPGAWDPFELAVRAILGQQVTVRGATELAGRIVARFGERLDAGDAASGSAADGATSRAPAPVATSATAEPTHLFPTPDCLRDAPIESVGMPRARAAAIRGLAAAVADRALVLDDGAPLDENVARLTALPGIGAWTAHYVAMRALGEPDAFPASDLGLRRALGGDDGPLSTAALEAVAEEWRPWRAYAAMHLWHM